MEPRVGSEPTTPVLRKSTWGSWYLSTEARWNASKPHDRALSRIWGCFSELRFGGDAVRPEASEWQGTGKDSGHECCAYSSQVERTRSIASRVAARSTSFSAEMCLPLRNFSLSMRRSQWHMAYES